MVAVQEPAIDQHMAREPAIIQGLQSRRVCFQDGMRIITIRPAKLLQLPAAPILWRADAITGHMAIGYFEHGPVHYAGAESGDRPGQWRTSSP